MVDGMVHHVVAPGSHLAPAVQHSHLLNAVRSRPLDIVIQSTEFLAYALHIIDEFRELHCQLQITAVSDPVDGLSKDGSSCRHPVHLGLFHRISAFMEHIREEIRQKPSLCIFYSLNIADKT